MLLAIDIFKFEARSLLNLKLLKKEKKKDSFLRT